MRRFVVVVRWHDYNGLSHVDKTMTSSLDYSKAVAEKVLAEYRSYGFKCTATIYGVVGSSSGWSYGEAYERKGQKWVCGR